jgi:hypothetical protein
MTKRQTPHPYSIRPEFLLAYFRRRGAELAKQFALIKVRDTKHRDLNREYGFRNDDGSIPIGRRAYTNTDYKARYDAIDAEFRPLYEAVSVEKVRADHEGGMTIFEFLVLHDLHSQEQMLFIDAASRTEYVDYIALRARSEVRGHAVGRPAKDARRVLAMLTMVSRYSGLACREFLGIKFWDIQSHLVILTYRNLYKHLLREAADNLFLSSYAPSEDRD